MQKKQLRNMSDSYGNKGEYSRVTDIIWKEVEHKVRGEMQKIPRAVELESKISENNKTFFDKKEEIAFQVDYGFTDDYGEDYPDYQYSEELYKNYQNFLANYDTILANLEAEKQKIQSAKFMFGRARKLEDIEYKIQSAKRDYKYYKGIQEREQKFHETWYRDGKFVDLNKDYKQELAEIRRGVVEKLVEASFDKHPELMMYDFYGTSFREDVIKAIQKEQNSRVLTAEKPKKSEKPEEEPEGFGMN